MKKLSLLFLLGIIIGLMSCGSEEKKEVKQTQFKDFVITDNYSIALPDHFIERGNGFWQTPKFRMKLKIDVQQSVSADLESATTDLSYWDNEDIYKDKELIKKEPFERNGMKGIIMYFNKEVNFGVNPAIIYYVFSSIQDGENLLSFSAISFEEDFTQDMRTSILSIKNKK